MPICKGKFISEHGFNQINSLLSKVKEQVGDYEGFIEHVRQGTEEGKLISDDVTNLVVMLKLEGIL